MPEAKSTPGADAKKPDASAKTPGTPPANEQKSPAAQAPKDPKTAAPAEKKPKDPPKEPPKAPPAPPTTPPPPPPKEPFKESVTRPKQAEDKGKSAAEPKQAETPKSPADAKKPTVEKKPEAKDAAPAPKAAASTEPKKPEDKAPAADPKGKSAEIPTKEDSNSPITVSSKDKVEIPTEPKDKATSSKDAPAADPKKKDTAVEPPKGVKITQIFADRLEKPTQEDLKSLPIPKEGEGFSMRLHPAYFFEFLDHPFSVNRETDDYRELFDSVKSVQQSIPIQCIYTDGIFHVGNKYSKSWQFTDVNYASASDDMQSSIFRLYCGVLNGKALYHPQLRSIQPVRGQDLFSHPGRFREVQHHPDGYQQHSE